jgi:hypothetical protein
VVRGAGVLGLFLLFGAAAYPADEPDPDLSYAETILKDARIADDGPSLLTFFRQRTLGATERGKLADMVQALGSKSFRVRKKAQLDLQRAGRSALAYLRPVLNHPDLEIAASARKLLARLEDGADVAVVCAAARVLAARRPPEAARVLLDYLPQAADESIEEAVLEAVAVVGRTDTGIDPTVSAALGSTEPLLRLAAVCVYGQAGPRHLRALKPLRTDTDARVRFQVAATLVRNKDKDAVPTLIDFLGDGPAELALRAEDLLCRIAGDANPGALDLRTAAGRRQCQGLWTAWWHGSSARIDLTRIDLAYSMRGLTLICEYNSGKNNQGRIWECGKDGKPRWVLDAEGSPLDAHLLPNGRVLIGHDGQHRVTERDRQGRIYWEKKVDSNVLNCQRLPNGNTFIATLNGLLEVTPKGDVVFTYQKFNQIYYGARLRNGHIVMTQSNHHLVELDASGKQVHDIPLPGLGWGSVDKLPNGRYLVSLYAAHKVAEVDTSGKVLWECSISTPTHATRLPNGNTLVSSSGTKVVVEFDRNGKEVWRQAGQAMIWRVRRR